MVILESGRTPTCLFTKVKSDLWKFVNSVVKSRAKCMGIDPKFVLKELLWKIDGKIVLIVSHGLGLIDETELAAQLNCKECTLVKPDDVFEITGTFNESNDQN